MAIFEKIFSRNLKGFYNQFDRAVYVYINKYI